jgi:hypothetical protein
VQKIFPDPPPSCFFSRNPILAPVFLPHSKKKMTYIGLEATTFCAAFLLQNYQRRRTAKKSPPKKLPTGDSRTGHDQGGVLERIRLAHYHINLEASLEACSGGNPLIIGKRSEPIECRDVSQNRPQPTAMDKTAVVKMFQ